MEALKAWIRDQYNDQPVFIQSRLIEKVLETILEIKRTDMYDKRLEVSSTLSIVLYKSGTIDLLSSHTNEMETFRNI